MISCRTIGHSDEQAVHRQSFVSRRQSEAPSDAHAVTRVTTGDATCPAMKRLSPSSPSFRLLFHDSCTGEMGDGMKQRMKKRGGTDMELRDGVLVVHHR